MPVRSLHSPVLKWPDRTKVLEELKKWSDAIRQNSPECIGIGYFGSYARGDWGVGSDLDLIIVVKDSRLPFEKRSLSIDATSLPVPVDLLIYTEQEWRHNLNAGFAAAISPQLVWLLEPGTAQ